MDRKKAEKLLGLFARQSWGDVEEIEKLPTDELVQNWKNLTWLNCIYGQVSLNEMERISLLELEMDTRKDIDKEELDKWYIKSEQKQKEWEKEEIKKYEEEKKQNG